jgi:multidrug efflux pump subunit AcrB
MQAVVDAAVSRVRPVSLGVLTTVLGVIPLLWDPFFKSLAVVIICGLSFATILTLIIVPTLYVLFFKVKATEV